MRGSIASQPVCTHVEDLMGKGTLVGRNFVYRVVLSEFYKMSTDIYTADLVIPWIYWRQGRRRSALPRPQAEIIPFISRDIHQRIKDAVDVQLVDFWAETIRISEVFVTIRQVVQ